MLVLIEYNDNLHDQNVHELISFCKIIIEHRKKIHEFNELITAIHG